MGLKYYCDHCGKDMGKDYDSLLYRKDVYFANGEFVGLGSVLCEDCHVLRIKLHANLDREFLKHEKEA